MTTQIARLVYDSSHAATRAELRGARSGNRTLLFESENFGVDAIVFPGAEGQSYVVHGHVRHRPSDDPAADVRTTVGNENATATRTDKHGQFSATLPTFGERLVITVTHDDIEVVCTALGETHG